jgi:hypothetical protein
MVDFCQDKTDLPEDPEAILDELEVNLKMLKKVNGIALVFFIHRKCPRKSIDQHSVFTYIAALQVDCELTTPPSRPKSYPAVTPYAKIQLAASKRAAAAAREDKKARCIHDIHATSCNYAYRYLYTYIHTYKHTYIHTYIYNHIYIIYLVYHICSNLWKFLHWLQFRSNHNECNTRARRMRRKASPKPKWHRKQGQQRSRRKKGIWQSQVKESKQEEV